MLIGITAAVVLLIAASNVLNRFSHPAVPPGIVNGGLAPLPETPNCVASQTDDPDRRMPPLPMGPDLKDPLRQIRTVVNSMPRTKTVTSDNQYLHVEFRSRLLGFIDDVEFLVDSNQQCIQFRSASRIGHSDFGVNRARMRAIAAAVENM
ncbi:MAG: DUF1499 domain-containing protein [Planctomycetaceae bacterium]